MKLTPLDMDRVIRTVYGEAALEPEQGQLGVASVIMNRAKSTGMPPADVVLQPHQFEPWSARRAKLEGLSKDSPIYRRISNTLQPLFDGQIDDPTGGADHFYSPSAQKALGRETPDWAAGQPGLDIGRHRFYSLGYGNKAEPMRLGPPDEIGAAVDAADREAAYDPYTAPPEPHESANFVDRARASGIGPALMRLGAGIAGNSHRGWGAGLGAGFAGASDAISEQQRINVANERTQLDQLPKAVAFRALYDQYRAEGLPEREAHNRAMITAFNPAAARAAGLDGGGDESFGTSLHNFVDEDGNVSAYQVSDKGNAKKVELRGEDGNALRPAPSMQKIDAGTEWIITDKTGAELYRVPKNIQEQAVEQKSGTDIGAARGALDAKNAMVDQMLGTVEEALNDEENRVAYHGYSGYAPWNMVRPSVRDFRGIDQQITGQNFLAGFQNVKGAGPVSDREGQAATAAQSEYSNVFSAEAKERALRKMQYLGVRAKLRNYRQADTEAPANLVALEKQYRKHFPEMTKWLDEGGPMPVDVKQNARPSSFAPSAPTIQRVR